jgi:hypothetical protein
MKHSNKQKAFMASVVKRRRIATPIKCDSLKVSLRMPNGLTTADYDAASTVGHSDEQWSNQLPECLLFAVFERLDRRSLFRAAIACRRWARVAADDVLWKR